MMRDFVCGMSVQEDGPETLVKSYGSERYYFCSPTCALLFSYDPSYYAGLRDDAARTANELKSGTGAMRKTNNERG